MPQLDNLQRERLRAWRQTPDTKIEGPEEAAELIARLGLVTLYPVSPDVPNLFHAYMGDPGAKTSPQWDSPSGRVYTWRWELGRAGAGFYATIVRGRPTWVSWELLPAALRLWGELRMPDELFDLGALSEGAYRIVRALEETGGVLSTADLREAAGFPTGKEQRAAYLRAVDELDARLLVAKVFVEGSEEMSHALVQVRYRDYADRADRLTREEAMDRFLAAYLPHARYAAPAPLARHLRLAEGELREGLARLVERGHAEAIDVGGKGKTAYIWKSGKWSSMADAMGSDA